VKHATNFGRQIQRGAIRKKRKTHEAGSRESQQWKSCIEPEARPTEEMNNREHSQNELKKGKRNWYSSEKLSFSGKKRLQNRKNSNSHKRDIAPRQKQSMDV